MSLQISTRVTKFIKIAIALSAFIAVPAVSDWSIDFSRRADQMKRKVVEPAEPEEKEEKSIFGKLFEPSAPMQEIVIINTEQGFVPSTVRVREGAQYRLVIVNVNEKAKNVSFVLDSFSEHHATFYGKMKSFMIHPKKEGVYTFVSPETSAQGRLVVHPASGKPETLGVEMRMPASE